ncbi:hypothetical protein CEE36_09240 [candidate division TA06 bacterium B3_TA06]|uniref:Uncharacterized protein n=1 Tax=candidate division TA06 bacterium B3_TA06 TaxID=2012487 RepID=A0A532V091_UNCT6|nr:MAG: hypothetical protein CEE36_09240 [candidate division TA06 bacterium B3_TA06]
MRSVMLFVPLLLLLSCASRLTITDQDLPVVPADNLVLNDSDTVLVGTITMLSDKLEAFDVVRIRGDTAFRVGRVLFDKSIQPYYGGIIRARLRPVEKDVYGYITKAELLEWSEEPLAREATREAVEVILDKQRERLNRILREKGFEAWESDGLLQLVGYDPEAEIAIYSMAARAVEEGNIQRQPILVVWASPQGAILKVNLTILNRILERR